MDVPEIVCIKVSQRIDGWLREAYFGRLLDGHPRAIRVFDAFPLMRAAAAGAVLPGARVRASRRSERVPAPRRRGWTEAAVRREIAGILEVLGKLHRGQLLHRDLTPVNVFVCDGRRLKLGDFGIVRQQSDSRGITARTMNALTAPSESSRAPLPKWQARDDVYQVGQLLAMLVKGDARARIRTAEVRAPAVQRSSEGDHLPLHRRAAEALRERQRVDRRRCATPPAPLKTGVLRTLKGVHLAFTGILSRSRARGGAGREARRRDRPRRRRRRGRRSSSAAGPTRCRRPAGRAG